MMWSNLAQRREGSSYFESCFGGAGGKFQFTYLSNPRAGSEDLQVHISATHKASKKREWSSEKRGTGLFGESVVSISALLQQDRIPYFPSDLILLSSPKR
jgi:hypothetical protein